MFSSPDLTVPYMVLLLVFSQPGLAAERAMFCCCFFSYFFIFFSPVPFPWPDLHQICRNGRNMIACMIDMIFVFLDCSRDVVTNFRRKMRQL